MNEANAPVLTAVTARSVLLAWGVSGPYEGAIALLDSALDRVTGPDSDENGFADWLKDVLQAASREETAWPFPEPNPGELPPDFVAIASALEKLGSFWWRVGLIQTHPYDVLSQVLSAHRLTLGSPNSQFTSESAAALEAARTTVERIRVDAEQSLDKAFSEPVVLATGSVAARYQRWRAVRDARAGRSAWMKARSGWDRYLKLCLSARDLHAAHQGTLAALSGIEDLVTNEVVAALAAAAVAPLEQSVAESREALTRAEKLFDSIRVEDLDDLMSRLEKMESELAAGFSTELIAALDTFDAPALTKRLEDFVADAISGFQDLPEMSRVPVEIQRPASGENGRPPKVDNAEIPIRSVILSHVEGDLKAATSEYSAGIAALLSGSIERVQGVRRAVTFNVESAIAEIEENGKQEQVLVTASELTLGGLQRAETRLAELHSDFVEKSGQLTAELQASLEQIRSAVREELAGGKAIELRLRVLRRQAKTRAGGYVEAGGGVGVRVRERIAGYLEKLKTVLQPVSKVFSWFGSATVAEDIEASVDEADRFDSAIDDLPAIYKRLFRLDPLEVDDFLIGREDAFATLKRARERFANGKPASVAVVGEMGSGKSSFLNCACQRDLAEANVVRITLDRTAATEADLYAALGPMFGLSEDATPSEVMSHLATSSTPIVAIVECGHEMFLRRVGGFDAVRAFLLLVTRTNENVFWMISMAEYAWVYLDRVVGISDFFPYLIETRNMVESDIEQAVMTRHEASGFKLVFTDGGSPSRKTERALRKAANDEARQAVLREDFFETLMESSRGNVQIALYLWLRCLTPRQDVIEVEPVPALSFPFVSRLPLPRLTALASILQHGTLTPSEHAEVFGMSPSASVLMFESLEDQGLIRPVHLTEEKSQDTSFMIAEMARRSIVDYLKTRNLFH